MTLAIVAFAVCLLAGAVLFAGTRPLERLRPGALAAIAGVTAAACAALLVVRSPNVLLADLAVLASALVLGSGLGSMLRGSVGLGSFCITAAIVDVVSSHSGATARIVEGYRRGTSNLLQVLSLSAPVGGRVRPIVGIGDIVVLACIYFALRRLGHRGALAFAAPLSGLLLAVVVGLVVGGAPALPFVAATTLAYLWLAARQRKSVAGAREGRDGELPA